MLLIQLGTEDYQQRPKTRHPKPNTDVHSKSIKRERKADYGFKQNCTVSFTNSLIT